MHHLMFVTHDILVFAIFVGGHLSADSRQLANRDLAVLGSHSGGKVDSF